MKMLRLVTIALLVSPSVTNAQTAAQSEIEIITAYWANVDVTKMMRDACRGKSQCEFTVSEDLFGKATDPEKKDLSLSWKCGGNGTVFSRHIEHNAIGKHVLIDCLEVRAHSKRRTPRTESSVAGTIKNNETNIPLTIDESLKFSITKAFSHWIYSRGTNPNYIALKSKFFDSQTDEQLFQLYINQFSLELVELSISIDKLSQDQKDNIYKFVRNGYVSSFLYDYIRKDRSYIIDGISFRILLNYFKFSRSQKKSLLRSSPSDFCEQYFPKNDDRLLDELRKWCVSVQSQKEKRFFFNDKTSPMKELLETLSHPTGN